MKQFLKEYYSDQELNMLGLDTKSHLLEADSPLYRDWKERINQITDMQDTLGNRLAITQMTVAAVDIMNKANFTTDKLNKLLLYQEELSNIKNWQTKTQETVLKANEYTIGWEDNLKLIQSLIVRFNEIKNKLNENNSMISVINKLNSELASNITIGQNNIKELSTTNSMVAKTLKEITTTNKQALSNQCMTIALKCEKFFTETDLYKLLGLVKINKTFINSLNLLPELLAALDQSKKYITKYDTESTKNSSDDKGLKRLDSSIANTHDAIFKDQPSNDLKFNNIQTTGESVISSFCTTAESILDIDAVRVTDLLDSINKYIDLLKQASLNIESKALKAAADTTSEKRDWEIAFKTATEQDLRSQDPSKLKNVDKVWNDYLDSEWPKNKYNRQTINRLTKAMNNEFKVYGYSDNTNPFVSFLHTVLLDNKFSTVLRNHPEGYFTLHNAIISGKVLTKDLTGIGDLRKLNLIFDPKLFELPAYIMNKFLDTQNLVVELFNNDQAIFIQYNTKDDPESNLLGSKYGNKRDDYFIDLFYKNGNILAGTTNRVAGNRNNSFHTLETIDKVLRLSIRPDLLTKATSAVTNIYKIEDRQKDNIAYTNIAAAITEALNIFRRRKASYTERRDQTTLIKHIILSLESFSKTFTPVEKTKIEQNINVAQSAISEKDKNGLLSTYFKNYNLEPAYRNSELLYELINTLYKVIKIKVNKE